GGWRDGQPGMDGSAAVARRVAATERQRELMSTHVDRDGDKKYRGQRLQDRRRSATNGNKNRDNAPGWPLDKSLCGIPTLYTWSLAYGRNLLRPERTTDPWRIRNLGTWLRPNPPVGALGDKVRPASSFITIATKARNRWFDLDAVRQPLKSGNEPGGPGGSTTGYRGVTEGGARVPLESHPLGAPPLDWHSDLDPDGHLHLILATEAYKGSHYAAFPRRLPEKFVQMMCPLRVCTVCGEPSRRIVEKSEEYAAARAQVGDFKSGRSRDSGLNGTVQYVDGRHMDRADNVL